MIRHYCDICGKKMQGNVINDNDPLDYFYGECEINIDIGLQGHYSVGFEEICHECRKRIANIDMDDFQKVFVEELMGIKRFCNGKEL